MTGAGLALTLMIAMVKAARTELGAFDIAFWRGITAAPLAFWMARQARGGLRLQRPGLLATRTLLGFGTLTCSFIAARYLAVADLMLIGKLQPLIVALLAPLVLGASERAGAMLWLLLLACLGGCALILAPDLAVGSVAGLLALAAAFLSAGAHLSVRRLIRDDDPRVVVLYFQLGVMALAVVAILIERGTLPRWPAAHLWPHLLGIGISATIGQLLLTRAYAEDRAALVAAAAYTTPIWAVLVDILVFATMPGWHVIVGGLLIVGAGLVMIFQRGEPGHG